MLTSKIFGKLHIFIKRVGQLIIVFLSNNFKEFISRDILVVKIFLGKLLSKSLKMYLKTAP